MFEVIIQGVNNMTVSDLYINSNDVQTFILFEEGGTKPCFKGYLEYCPMEFMYRLVDKFRAIDFNMIEVILLWVYNVSRETFK